MSCDTIHTLIRVFACVGLFAAGQTPVLADASDPAAFPASVAGDMKTPVPSTINSEYVLTADGSPYLVPTDVLITETGSLTVREGVTVYVGKGVRFVSYGGMTVSGTDGAPVIFAADIPGQFWDGFLFYGLADSVRIEYARISGVSDVWPACHVQNAVAEYYHTTITGGYSAIQQTGGSVIIDGCLFPYAHAHDVISVKQGATAVISGTEIVGGNDMDSDAIDLEGVVSASIMNCLIRSSGDDGIDVGVFSTAVTIVGTRMYQCADKGVSVGQQSVAVVDSCIIAECEEGVKVFGGSQVTVTRSTISGGDFGVVAEMGENGHDQTESGFATLRNTIVSGMTKAPVAADTESAVNAEYCLIGTGMFGGEGNVTGDPRFRDMSGYDFRLKSDSPAIDAASPGLGTDHDGSRREIGAVSFVSLPLVINEINYCSDDIFDTGDWVEVYNPHTDTVDVSQWVFMDSDDGHRFEFPDNRVILPDSYLVIVRNSVLFGTYFPELTTVIGDMDFGFSPDGELVRLLDGRGVVMDSLTYGSYAPWPEAANGTGATLALADPSLDNTDPLNWRADTSPGTPGEPNGYLMAVDDPAGALSRPFSLGQNYPNPFNPSTTIPFSIESPGHTVLTVYSITGQKIAMLLDRYLEPGTYRVWFSPDGLAAGQYFTMLSHDRVSQSIPMMYVK